MDLVLLVLLGVVVGTVGTLVGTGGGWALVPIFLLGLGFTPVTAAATSLCVVFLNAVSGTVSYLRQGRVRLGLALLLAACTVPGAIAGTWLSGLLDRRTFTTAFAVFLLLVATSLFTRGRALGAVAPDGTLRPLRVAVGAVASTGVGVVSSVLGVGGGIIHVPLLILVVGMDPHRATATSHFVLAVTSAVGAVGYALGDHVRWTEALTVGGGAVVGAQLGARLSSRIGGPGLQRTLAVLLCAFALTLLFVRL